MGNVIARQRLFLNAEKTKLVAEGDVEGAFLYVAPGDEIPEDAHDLFELVDGALPDFTDAPADIEDKVPNMAPPPGPKEKQAQRAAKALAKAQKGPAVTKEAGSKDAGPGQDKEAKPGDDKAGGGAGEGAGGEKGQ